MNRPQRFTASQQPKFKLPAFEEDKRLAFVDSVCATLMTSRFGYGAMYTLNPRFEGTADEPFDYLSLLEKESLGWHEAATFLGRAILRRAIAGGVLHNPARSKGIESADTTLGRNRTTPSPAYLGRGSPKISGTCYLQPGVSPGNIWHDRPSCRRQRQSTSDTDAARIRGLQSNARPHLGLTPKAFMLAVRYADSGL